jgi:hypothetical protein
METPDSIMEAPDSIVESLVKIPDFIPLLHWWKQSASCVNVGGKHPTAWVETLDIFLLYRKDFHLEAFSYNSIYSFSGC